MSVERSRQFGRALMAASVLTLVAFVAGAARRSYAALALPVFAGLAVVSGLAFWVGYTMATTRWEDEIPPLHDRDEAGAADDEVDEVAEAEGAPPPETIARHPGT